jgi:hypothetical protein
VRKLTSKIKKTETGLDKICKKNHFFGGGGGAHAGGGPMLRSIVFLHSLWFINELERRKRKQLKP